MRMQQVSIFYFKHLSLRFYTFFERTELFLSICLKQNKTKQKTTKKTTQNVLGANYVILSFIHYDPNFFK